MTMMIFLNSVAKIMVMILVVVAMNTEAVSQKKLNEQTVLFDFSNKDANMQWQTVNDGVMGGRSEGRFRILKDGMLEFYGMLSLENNGGFASVRSKPRKLDLQKDDSIIARVRGDGR